MMRVVPGSVVLILVGIVSFKERNLLCSGTIQMLNPFEKGCLRTMAERFGDKDRDFQMRVCNSDDDRNGKQIDDVCIEPKFEYFESRVITGDWDEGKRYLLSLLNYVVMIKVLNAVFFSLVFGITMKQ